MDDRTSHPGFLARAARLVDGVLRGTRGTDPRRPPESRVPFRDALLVAVPLAAFYGLCMGLGVGPATAAMDALKIPLVLVLACVICLPSFYVFAALTGAPIRAADTARSLAGCALLTSVVWAALAPVTGFFTLSTNPTSGFIVVLHTLVLGVGLLVGVVFLGREIAGRKLMPRPPVDFPIDETDPVPAPLPLPEGEVHVSIGFLLIWLIVFAFVVCQLFADFAPYLEEGPFVTPVPRFFLEGLGSGVAYSR